MRTCILALTLSLSAVAFLGAGKGGKAPKPAAPANTPPAQTEESLPANIKTAIEKLMPSATIVSYEHQMEDTRHLYFVDVQNAGTSITLLYSGRAQYLGQVSDDGEEDDDVYIDKDTAPQAVKDGISKYFAGAPIDFLFMEVDKEKFIFCAEQTPAGKKTRWANFNLAGTVVSEESEMDLKDVPAVVKTAIAAARPAGKIDSVNMLKQDGVTSYVADVVEGKATFEVTSSADGKITGNEPADDTPATKP